MKEVFQSIRFVATASSLQGQSYFRSAYPRILEEEIRLTKELNILATEIELQVSDTAVRVVFMTQAPFQIHSVYEIQVGLVRASHIKRLNL